jgi:hypothetical protein
MVQQVQDALRDQELGFLCICGHGDAGWVNIGRGLDASVADLFGALQPRFARYKRGIKIMGCGVASDTPLVADPLLCQTVPQSCGVPTKGIWSATNNDTGNGYQLLKALANATQAPVQAAVHAQANFFPHFFTFQGLTVVVYPDDGQTEDRFTSHGFLGLGKKRFIKHNDFCTLEYDEDGNDVYRVRGG